MASMEEEMGDSTNLFGWGAVNARIAGRWWRTPARNSCPNLDIPYFEPGPLAMNTLLAPCQILTWTWEPLPAAAALYLPNGTHWVCKQIQLKFWLYGTCDDNRLFLSCNECPMILLHQESCPKHVQESSSSKSEGSNLWTQYDNTTYWYSEFKDAHLGKNVACRRCLFAIATTASRMKSRLSAAVRHGTWLMAISNWPPPDSACICQMYPKKVSTQLPLQCSKPDISIWPWFYDYALVFWECSSLSQLKQIQKLGR